ncbi:MAG: DUF86 domain-containing protein [Sulfurospirillaceae bacterium]|nr:DUF86 domain-containing protein [Sulfurospirillaceae bacterium]
MRSKNARDIELFIIDVFISIYKIKSYTAMFRDGQQLQGNSLHWDATMRAFEIIGESLNYLLENESFDDLAPSYFRKIVNFRNVIAHGYFGIDADEVWDIVTDKLNDLNEDLLSMVSSQFNIQEALVLTIQEYTKREDKNIVEYLNTLMSAE